jgi:hypothetical protein
MKFSIAASVLLLAIPASALPYGGGKRETAPSWRADIDPRTAQSGASQLARRQVPVEVPSMSVGGVVRSPIAWSDSILTM